MLTLQMTYLIARMSLLRDRWRADVRDGGLTTLEVAIIAGGLAVLAAGVVAAIVAAANKHKAQIK